MKEEYFNVNKLPFIGNKIRRITLGYLESDADCLDLTSQYIDNDIVDNVDLNVIKFEMENGNVYYLAPDDDSFVYGCDNYIFLADINGTFNDLIGTEIVVSEERTKEIEDEEGAICGGYTFYTFRTQKGTLDLRFECESNGCYGVLMKCFNEEELTYEFYHECFVKCKIFE